jgi:glycosyltransferase involved in cell wall biosynthesis
MTMDSGPLLSAVFPNFNHGIFIGDAIRALVKQELAPDEIVVVDDGSTDNSIEVLEQLRLEYPKLQIISLKENHGAIFALNRGLRAARGRYVNFGAADDLTHPGLFAAMLDALRRYPQAAFACCEAVMLDMDSGRIGFRPPVRPSHTKAFFEPAEVAKLLRRIDNWILPGTAVVRRDVAMEIGGFEPALEAFGDSFLFRKLALRHGFCFAPKLGLTWRVSASGLSRSKAANPADSMRTLASAVSRMRADPDFPTWYPEVFERRWRFGIGRIAAIARPMNRAVLTQLNLGPIGRAVMNAAIAVGGPIGRFAALVWLTLHYRPTSIPALVRTALARRWATRWREGR